MLHKLNKAVYLEGELGEQFQIDLGENRDLTLNARNGEIRSRSHSAVRVGLSITD